MTSEQINNKAIAPHDENPLFNRLVEQLKELHRIVVKSSYIKRSAQILNVLIDDATQPKKVLILGRNGEHQATFINAQLNRPLMPLLAENTVISTSIIRYGHEEKITAHFLDGQIASFDLSHLVLFTSAHSEGAHILQEGLDYVDVFLNEPLLQQVSLIDVPTISTDRMIFIQPSILRRADDIYCLIEDSELTDAEKRLLKRLNKMDFEPLAITMKPLQLENDLFRDIVVNDKERVMNELQSYSAFRSKRISKITDRFLQWLDRFYMEVMNLMKRDPYLEAREQLEKEIAQLDVGPSYKNEEVETLQLRIERIIKQYNKAQTIYQLIQFIKQHTFIEDAAILEFVLSGNQYLEEAHQYRRIQKNYAELQVEVETLERKSRSKLMLSLFTKEHTDKLQHMRSELPVLREQLLQAYKRTKHLEEVMQEQLTIVVPKLHTLVGNEIERLMELLDELQGQLPKGPTKRFKAVQRLKSFDSLQEAQIYLNQFLIDMKKTLHLYLSEEQQRHLEKSAANIATLQFDYHHIIEEALKLPEVSSKYAVQLEPLATSPLNVKNAFFAIEKPDI